MADFGERLMSCMNGKSLIVPDMSGLEEAIQFVGDIKDAWEQSGGSDELLIGALIVTAPFLGEEELAVLQVVAEVAVVTYLTALALCLWQTSSSMLLSMNENGELPGFLVAMLDDQGVDLNSAVA